MNRGNYKKHDYSISNMPKSTRYRLAKKLKAQEMEELQQIYLIQPNSHIEQQQNLIEQRESLIEQQEPLLQYQEQIIEQQTSIQITDHHESNNTLIYLSEQSDDDDIDDDNENENADSLNELLRDGITKEELAAAYLASFYSGKTTQSSLTDYLQLSNIYKTNQYKTHCLGNVFCIDLFCIYLTIVNNLLMMIVLFFRNKMKLNMLQLIPL